MNFLEKFSLEINIIIFLLIFLFIVLYKLIRFSLIILKTKEAIEDSLDIMDESYSKMSSILEIPIFNDSLQIQEVVKEIKHVRDNILYIANIMSSSIDEEVEEDD